MDDLGFGKIITTPQKRDAIHIAVVPVVASCYLSPGERIGLDEKGRATCSASKDIGIVDPFLITAVMSGQTFWMYLFPGSITSLRHKWTHPSFPKEEADDE